MGTSAVAATAATSAAATAAAATTAATTTTAGTRPVESNGMVLAGKGMGPVSLAKVGKVADILGGGGQTFSTLPAASLSNGTEAGYHSDGGDSWTSEAASVLGVSPRNGGTAGIAVGDDRAAPSTSSSSNFVAITMPAQFMPSPHAPKRSKAWFRPKVIFGVLGVIVIMTALMLLSKNLVVALLGLVEGSGIMGPVVLAFLFVLVSFPFFYGYSVFAVAGGFLFPFQVALSSVLLGSTVGSVMNLWLSQRFFGPMIQKKLGKYKFYRAIIRAIEKDAFKIIVLCRLIPVPYGIMNSILAVSLFFFFFFFPFKKKIIVLSSPIDGQGHSHCLRYRNLSWALTRGDHFGLLWHDTEESARRAQWVWLART